MEQLPTWTDIKLFFKASWKTIVAVMFALFLLYGAALGYTVLSQRSLPNEDEVVSGGVSLKGITKEEYLALKEDEVSFSFYVENADDTPFMNYNLLKTVLLSPTVFPSVTENLSLDYDVPDMYTINISRDNTNAMYMNIGTGNIKDNMKLANRLYTLLEKDELSFFADKKVYLLTKPKKVTLEEQLENAETSDVEPSSVNYILLALVGIIFAFIGGVVISVILSFFKKEFVFTSLVHFKNVNKVIDLSHLKDVEDPSEYLPQVIVQSSIKGEKLVLSQTSLTELGSHLKSSEVTLASSLLQIQSNHDFKEAIVIIEKNKTEKNWYHNQKILLENYNIPIKIVLL